MFLITAIFGEFDYKQQIGDHNKLLAKNFQIWNFFKPLKVIQFQESDKF